MLFKITGGLFLLLTGLGLCGIVTVSPKLTGVLAILAGIGLLAGI